MSNRNVVIGAGGRLGSALCAACTPEHPAIAMRRTDLDLENSDSIHSILEGLEYDTLWLSAALTHVDYCETHPEQTHKVNSDAAKMIAQISAKKGARVILFSTDYVFDGKKDTPYLEDDVTHPLNIYGQSKLLAENHVLAAADQNLVIRLSWLFGNDKPGFPSWAIHQAMQTESLSVVSNRRSSPTYTRDVITALNPLIRGETEISGILHLCNEGVCTWQEWAQYCIDCAEENGIELLSREVGSCLMSDIESFEAERPAYSAMSTTRFESISGQAMPNWKDGVNHYISNHLAPKLKNENNL